MRKHEQGISRLAIALGAAAGLAACGEFGANADGDRGVSLDSTADRQTGGYGGLPNLASSAAHRLPSTLSRDPALGAAGVWGRSAVSLDGNDSFAASSHSFTVIPYAGELYDDCGNYDLVAKRYWAFTTESIQVCASLASFTSDFELDIFVNGQREKPLAIASRGIAQGCRIIRVNGGDYVDVRVYQESGTNLSFPRNHYWNWMTVEQAFMMASTANNPTISAIQDTFTTLPFSDELFDPFRMYNPQSGSFTETLGEAEYQFCASLAPFGVDFELDLFLNGSRERGFAVASHGAAGGCRVVTVPDETAVDVRVHQGQTASMTIPPNTNWNWFTAELVHVQESLGDIATFSAPSDQFTTVPFSSRLHSKSGEYDFIQSRFTAAASDKYQFCASVASFGQVFELDLFINGSRENAFALSRYGIATGCRTLRMQANDFVEVKLHHSTGAPVTFPANGLWNWLTVHRHTNV